MLAARMHEYHKSVVLEQVQETRSLSGENVLVKVGEAGICRTDLQMIDGYFREYLPLELPCPSMITMIMTQGQLCLHWVGMMIN